MPDGDFDIRRHQLVPGRSRMIEGLRRIERHRGEVRSLNDKTIQLASGEEIETDVLLWAHGTPWTLSISAWTSSAKRGV